MNIEFLSIVAVIAPDPPVSRKLYGDVLGLPPEAKAATITTATGSFGCKSFGIWSLSRAAEASFEPPQ